MNLNKLTSRNQITIFCPTQHAFEVQNTYIYIIYCFDMENLS